MGEVVRFVSWEVMKALALAFLGLLAAKAVSNLRSPAIPGLRALRAVLYAVIVALVSVGARPLGDNWAAQVCLWASHDHLAHGQVARAYNEALRSVQLRPGRLASWRALAEAKLAQNQFASILDDRAAFLAASGDRLDEADDYLFAFCTMSLGQYDQTVSRTQEIIRRNPTYVAPHILQGEAYLAEKKYPEAQRAFLNVLQMFPDNQAAVEGLAHAYYLAGDRALAVALLNETARFGFSADARKRFEALKALYGE